MFTQELKEQHPREKMKKTNLYWLTISTAIAVGVFISLIQTNYVIGQTPKLIFIILTEVFFYAAFTRIYDTEFFKGHWMSNGFIPVFLSFFLTSILYFFQNNNYLIYSTWAAWVVVITWANSNNDDSPKETARRIANIFMIFLLVLWITGFAFIELGSLSHFNYTFSKSIYQEIPFLQWTVGIRGMITVILFVFILIKPLFFMNWKLDKSEPNVETAKLPSNSNIATVFLKSILNGLYKAGLYLDKLRLSTRTYINRYWKELLTILKQTKRTFYSICLMTLTLITMFILGRIAFLMGGLIYSLIKPLSVNSYIHDFVFIILHILLLYVFLLINWFLLNHEIFYDVTNKEKVKKAIWYVFDEYTKTLLVKIPHFFWFISGIVWLSVTLLNLFANKPFLFPGAYAPLLLIIHILIFLVYTKFKKKNA